MAGMKASILVALLLLGVLATTHAHQVKCQNSCQKPIYVNGQQCQPGGYLVIEVDVEIVISVVDVMGEKHYGHYQCAKNVKEITVIYEELWVKVKVTGIIEGLFGFLAALLGSKGKLLSCKLY